MTAGTGLLLRLALRRDRVWVAAWLGGLVVVALASVAAIDRFYPSGMARRALAASVTANPGLRALTGPLFDTSTGALVAWRVTGTLAVLLALLNLLLVVRHSRGDEEQGRTELVGATAVARPAPLVAALVTAALTDLVLA
ncbi:MAG: ABC transporter permease, partial [Actinomycetota bacterium]